MKIGFVLDDRLDKPDGVQQYIKLLGSWLQKQGNEVHYLVGNSPGASQKNVHNLGRTVGVRFNKNRMAIPLPASGSKIKSLLKKEHFDVLHVQMPYSPLLAGKVIKHATKDTAVVGTFHILPHDKLSKFGTKALGVLLHNNKKRFDGFISVSSAARVFAKSHFGISSTVLPNVVDLDKYQKGSALKNLNDKKNILFLGRFVERKGAHYLLNAYQELIKNIEVADVPRLIMCGDGPDMIKLKKMATEVTAVKGEIVFTGFLNEHEKADYLASADVAVFPSTGGESFGIVLIEAMAAGSKVVLGGDNDGYKTVLGDQPFSLIHPQDTAMFSQRLNQLLFDKEFALTLGNKQKESVKQYDIKVVGLKIVDFYKHSLASRRNRDNN